MSLFKRVLTNKSHEDDNHPPPDEQPVLDKNSKEDKGESIPDIEEFPCGNIDCRTFIPHLWKPDMCRVCFKSKKSKYSTESPEDRSSLTPYNAFHKWERQHKIQCEMLKDHLIRHPLVENVMIKNVMNINSKEETEIICHIVLSENYENVDLSSMEQSRINEEQSLLIKELKEKDESLRQDKWRLLQMEKDLLENERKLTELENQITRREVVVANREKETLQALFDLHTKEEEINRISTTKNNELKSKNLELEATKNELLMKQKELLDLENSLKMQSVKIKDQSRRMTIFKEKSILEEEKLLAEQRLIEERKQKQKKQLEEDINEVEKLLEEDLFKEENVLKEDKILKELNELEEDFFKSREKLMEEKNSAQRLRRFNAGKQPQTKSINRKSSNMNLLTTHSDQLDNIRTNRPKFNISDPIIRPSSGWNISPYEEEEQIEKRMEDEYFILDYPENDIFYYRENFMLEPRVYEEIEQATKYFKLGRLLQRVEPWHFHDHVNFLIQPISDKVIVSIRKTPDSYGNFIGIYRSKIGDQPFILNDLKTKSNRGETSSRDLLTSFKKKYTNFKDDRVFVIECKKEVSVRKIQNLMGKTQKFLPEDLLDLDRKLKVRNYKFAVIYCASGQTNFDDILNDRNASPMFYQFLDLMADRIKIKGWKGYKADLDVKTNTTCLQSYYTEWNGLEIMFHVAPMLEDHCRNRIIGNDVVAIIWIENGIWDPSIITSQVLHAQIILKPVPSEDGKTFKIKVSCVAKDGVPKSRPKISEKLWDLGDDLRDFILKKCVNTERAAWHCHTTVRSQSRSMQDHLWMTREGQLAFLLEKYTENAKAVLL